MRIFFAGVLMSMVLVNAYANCDGRILHAGNGRICLQMATDDIARPRLCTQVHDEKYCASLVAGNFGRLRVALNGITYSVPEFMAIAESIQFDGASYIDLGFLPTTDLNFEIRANLDESENYRDGALLGARQSVDDQYVVWYNTKPGYNLVAPRFFYRMENNNISVPSDALTLRWENEVFTINGVAQDIGYFTIPMNQGYVNLVLGGLRWGDTVDRRRFLGDIYYAKFWDGNGVIMDLVPATDAAGVAGMYDNVSRRMLYLKQ